MPLVQLGQRRIERAAACGARGQRDVGLFALEHEGLSRECFSALQIGAGDRRGLSQGSAFSHTACESRKRNRA